MIRSIEGLRGVAALLVALFHAYVYSQWGGFPASSGVLQHAWLFVDLFFVISGYVMVAAYGDRLDSGRAAVGYMVRRFFRLYPLHIVTTATVLLAVIAIQSLKLVLAWQGIQVGREAPFDFEFFDLKLLGLDLLLLQGVGIMRKEIHNYPSWSISVEFWLYMMFALLMLVVRPRLARVAASVLIVGMSLAYFVIYWSTAPEPLRTLDTRGLPRGMLSFFQGVLVFYIHRWLSARRTGSTASMPASWLGVGQALAVILALYLVDRQPVLGTAQLAIPFAFALVVLLLVPDRGFVAGLLQTRPMQWLGLHSYSIYLTHVTVLTLLDWLGHAVPEPGKHLVGLFYVAAVFGASMLTYRFIEEPWRQRGRRLADRIEAGESFARPGDSRVPR